VTGDWSLKRSLALILASLLLLAGCGRSRHAVQADPLMDVFERQAQEEGLDRQQTLGKRLFGNYCATCHGDRGEGDGQNAYNLDPVPPNFKDALKSHPPSYWRQIIEGGTAALGRSPLCPPWGLELTKRQIDSIVSYMKVLAEPAAESKSADSKQSAVNSRP
jgi:mono/diheme cytochrome c family protein